MISFEGPNKRLVFPPPKLIPDVKYHGWAAPTPLKNPPQMYPFTNVLEATSWMRDSDFTCLILGSGDITLQRAHLVKVINDDVSRQRVIDRIRALGLVDTAVREDFNLDHPTNIIPLDPGMHAKWNLYGIWAVTGSLSTLQNVLHQVEIVNRKWQASCNQRGERLPVPTRFVPMVESFVDPIFEVVVLQRDHMIRDELWFAGRPQSQARNLPLVKPGMIFVHKGILKIKTTDGEIIDYPPFYHHSGRESHNQINIFLIILNAHAIFQYHKRHFGFERLSTAARELIALTEQIVEAIHFVPSPAAGSTSRGVREGETLPTERSAVVGGNCSGSMDPRHYMNIDDRSGDEHGLTREEMDALEARMTDPNLTSKERAAAGMKFLFGNKTYAPIPEVPGVPAPIMISGLDSPSV